MSEPLEWNDDDFNPATMEDDVIYIGTRKYVAEDSLHATVIEQQSEIERLREGLSEAHMFAVIFLGFTGRDIGTDREDKMMADLTKLAVEVDGKARAALGATK